VKVFAHCPRPFDLHERRSVIDDVLNFRLTMRLRILAFSIAAVISAASAARAQDAERSAVLATVQKVFDAMRTRDTAIFSQVFDSSARFVGVSTRGTPAITLTTPGRFAAAVAGAKAGDVWNERIFDPEVRIDGDLAQVWAYYTFHLNKSFSHCGVDAFMLRKVGGAWKITQLSDTRRAQGCTHTEPPGV
jgi:hypothetical protein